MEAVDVNDVIRPLLLKDLRVQCRARGISPAGSREALADRLKDHMLATNDFQLRSDGATATHATDASPPSALPTGGNNYHRSEGQNVGNFLTDRPSSRVLAPPGGGASQVSFGGDTVEAVSPKRHAAQKAASPVPAGPAHTATCGDASNASSHTNNYHRAGGQNVGNFLTDRNTSRVLAPPGGVSQVSIG